MDNIRRIPTIEQLSAKIGEENARIAKEHFKEAVDATFYYISCEGNSFIKGWRLYQSIDKRIMGVFK